MKNINNKYLLFLGQAITVYLLVNLGQFLFHLLQTETIYNCQFDNGAFFLNGNQIGYEIKQSIGFILFLFIIQIYVYHIQKKDNLVHL